MLMRDHVCVLRESANPFVAGVWRSRTSDVHSRLGMRDGARCVCTADPLALVTSSAAYFCGSQNNGMCFLCDTFQVPKFCVFIFSYEGPSGPALGNYLGKPAAGVGDA